MLLITRADIRRAITMPDAIDAAREAFIALSTGRADVPLRTPLTTAGGVMLAMPGYAPDSGVAGLKLVSVNPGNAERGRPTVQAVVLLVETDTGTPSALLEGTFLTQLRTGAAIGLGAELFALPDADTVALFGAGGTACTSLWAVCSVRTVREVRVVHPHAERFPAFQSAMRDLLGDSCPPLRRVESAAAALAGARIVVSATTSPVPLFPGRLLEPGAYVGALGAYTPATRELDTAAVLRSRLVVDTRAGALEEAGELNIPIQEGRMTAADIWAEIGEVAAGPAAPARTISSSSSPSATPCRISPSPAACWRVRMRSASGRRSSWGERRCPTVDPHHAHAIPSRGASPTGGGSWHVDTCGWRPWGTGPSCGG